MSKESLNGYEFIATYRPEAEEGILPGRIILGRSACPEILAGALFVTAYLPDGESAWQFGHYFDNRLEASKDYALRSERGM